MLATVNQADGKLYMVATAKQSDEQLYTVVCNGKPNG